jgi:glycosyltransferase involved in cell wall biosynthesis
LSEPTVSVVIPAYRAAGTIGRALDSLLGQTHRPDEVIVVDDGSTDDLDAALVPYAGLARHVRKPNGGAATARNLGIDQARGDLVAFLDADDYWEPTKLERQVSIFHDHPEVGVVAARFFEEPPGRPRFLKPAGDRGLFGRVLTASGGAVFEVMAEVWTTTVVVRRDVLGDARFVPGLEPAEDRDLWLRLIALSPVYLDPEPLATWVQEPGSLSRTNLDRDCSNMLRVVYRHRDLLGGLGLRAWETYVFRRWAAGHLGQGRPGAALGYAWERLRRQPASPEAWWILFKCMTMAGIGVRSRHRAAAHAL